MSMALCLSDSLAQALTHVAVVAPVTGVTIVTNLAAGPLAARGSPGRGGTFELMTVHDPGGPQPAPEPVPQPGGPPEPVTPIVPDPSPGPDPDPTPER
jgi:hypothetical protein